MPLCGPLYDNVFAFSPLQEAFYENRLGQNTTDDLACIKYKVYMFGCQLSKCWPLLKMDDKSGATRYRVAPISFCRVFGAGQLSVALFFRYRRQDFLRALHRALTRSAEHLCQFCHARLVVQWFDVRRRAALRHPFLHAELAKGRGSASMQMDTLCPSGAT